MNWRSFYGAKKKPLPLITERVRDIAPPDVSEESDLSSDTDDEMFCGNVTESETEEEIEEENETEEEIEEETEAEEIEENADMAISDDDSVIHPPSPPVVKKPTRGGNAGKYKHILLIIHALSCYPK